MKFHLCTKQQINKVWNKI